MPLGGPPQAARPVLLLRAMAQHGTWGAWVRQLGREQRRLRRSRGLSEDEFARLAAVDFAVVHALETGLPPVAPVPVMLKINLALRRLAQRDAPGRSERRGAARRCAAPR